jgi:hypothetical protein
MRLKVVVVISDANNSMLTGKPGWKTMGALGHYYPRLYYHTKGKSSKGSWVSFMVFFFLQVL